MNSVFAKRTDKIPFLTVISICCAFSSCMIMLYAVDKYHWLTLLPISFLLCSIVFYSCFKMVGKSITVTALIALMFLKNVIIPTLMALGNGYFAAYLDTNTNMLAAIVLEIYEELTVFIVLYFKLKSLKSSNLNSYTEKLSAKKNSINTFSIITLFLVLVATVCLVMYPQLTSYIKIGILGDNDEIIQQARILMAVKASVPTLIYYTYTLVINILRWVLPAMVLLRCYISNKRESTKILWSYLFIGVSVIITTDTMAFSIFIALAYSLLLCRMYPTKRKSILFFSISVVSFGGFFALLFKTFGSGGFHSAAIGEIAYMFQAYFSGPENVAVALAVDTPFSVYQFLGDILKYIPYLQYFFQGLPSSNILFNNVYWNNNDIVTQIIPMISQGARHFSVIFAPVYTAMLTNLSIKSEIKATREEEVFKYMICSIGCVIFSFSIVMYNMSLFISIYLGHVLPLYLIVWIAKKIHIVVKSAN